MTTSNALVLNTRPDLAARYRKSSRLALLSTGMAGCSTHSSPFLSLSCGQWGLFPVFLFSGNVMSMMVPSTTHHSSLAGDPVQCSYELLCCEAKQLQNVGENHWCIKIAVSLRLVKWMLIYLVSSVNIFCVLWEEVRYLSKSSWLFSSNVN